MYHYKKWNQPLRAAMDRAEVFKLAGNSLLHELSEKYEKKAMVYIRKIG